MIQLMVLRWEEYLGLSVSAQCNHKDPYEGEARGSQTGVDGSTGTGAGMKHFADGGEDYHLQQEKKEILLEPPEGTSYRHLDFSPVRLILDV